MRVLLFPVGSAGDVHPFVGLGQRLHARGNAVTLFTSGYFASLVSRAGLDFVETLSAGDYVELQKQADLWRPIKSFKVLFGHPRVGQDIRRQYRFIEERYVPGDTVVVAGTLAFGPRIARDKLGVPVVSAHVQPAVIKSLIRTPVFAGIGMKPWWPRWLKRAMFWVGDRWIVDPIIGPTLNQFRAELGLPPVRSILTEWMHSPDRVIGLFPDWYGPPAPDWPPQVRLTGFPMYDEGDVKPLGDDVREFLDAGERPVVVTFGSAMQFARPYFTAAAAALTTLGRRGIFLTPYREQLPGELPAGVAQFDYVPLGQLLPRAACLVHHGGIGTAAQGLAAGVPQLVMPLAHDQPDNAERLRRLGVGRALSPRRFTNPRNVARELTVLDAEEVRRACREVAAKFRGADPLRRACELIEQTGRTGGDR
jgi:rhamnosyltransferase subunit B